MTSKRGLDHASSVIRLDEPNTNSPDTRLKLKDVVARLCEKDHEAFEIIYNHYHSPLWNHLRSLVYDPEATADLFQETFERVWRNVEPKVASYFERWLYRIAVNLAYDYIRHKKLIYFHTLPESSDYTPAELRVEGDEERICTLLCLQEAVALLSPQCRTCLVLQHYWGYTQRKIAKILQINESTVSAYVSRGYKQILEHYDPLMAALKRAEAAYDVEQHTYYRGRFWKRVGRRPRYSKQPAIRHMLLRPARANEIRQRLQHLWQEEACNEGASPKASLHS